MVLLLAPTEFSAISEVHGSCFISDHKIVSYLVDFSSVANHQDKVVTFRQYHKINIVRLIDDLAASTFLAYHQITLTHSMNYIVSSLFDLLDVHAPMKTRRLTKPAPGWITNAKCL